MPQPIDFIFGFHFHQPVGNFEVILEQAYQDAYLPLMDTFREFEDIKLNLHISSPLLEFFKEKHPDFIEKIRLEIAKGKIEMLGGGFYEPILISIPERDIRGQLKITEDFLKENFSTSSRGIWLTERVWEPHIPSLLKNTSVEYLIVDDTHFIQSGFPPEKLMGYYLTEDQGNILGVFIINKSMRYHIPFQPVDKIMEKFREYSQSYKKPLICMIDDGEKFGLWPHTREWVYEKGWLKKFFYSLQENSSWLKTHTLSEYFDGNPPLGKAYLPTCTYYEMLEWSLPAESTERLIALKESLKQKDLLKETDPFLVGSLWRNYFSKYPESNYMHKKMLYLSQYLEQSKEKFSDKHLLNEAYQHLYKAQCNCPYWHGVFGGVYLPHLRNAIYYNLNKLHGILDKINYPKGEFVRIECLDIDGDKTEEILIDTDSLFLCISPGSGGMVQELSDKVSGFNHLNTISRKREFYHHEILKETDRTEAQPATSRNAGIESIHDIARKDYSQLKKYLIYDAYPRKSFIDHFLPTDTTLDKFLSGNYIATSTPLINYSCTSKFSEDSVKLTLGRDISYYENILFISKTFIFEKGKRGFLVNLEIENRSPSNTTLKYTIEFNFSMLTDNSPEKSYSLGSIKTGLSETGVVQNISSFGISDSLLGFAIKVSLNKETEVWHFPIRTVANSEAGFELSYQSSCMLPVFNLNLTPREKFSLNLNYFIEIAEKVRNL